MNYISKSRSIRGKLRVYHYLRENDRVRPFLPYTTAFTETNLKKALNNHSSLYVKPDYGKQGKGIYKVVNNKPRFHLKSLYHNKTFKDSSTLYRYLKKNSGQKLIIQKGINIERIQGKPYDVRVMVQRKPKGAWTVTGIFAKVGSPNKIVTNYSQGGRLSSMKSLFNKKGLSASGQQQRMREMERVSLNIANTLSKKRSNMYQLGVDLAYDSTGKLWILEVNSIWPQFSPVKWLDRKMYNRMLSFARSYGRYS